MVREQRSSFRNAYHYWQAIGPIYDGLLPSRHELFDVICEDLSAGGIAFHLDWAPDFQDLVVALGRPPALSHFTARVVRIMPKAHDGKQVYLVGCCFTGRIHL